MNHVIEVPCGRLGLTGHAPEVLVRVVYLYQDWGVLYSQLTTPDIRHLARGPP